MKLLGADFPNVPLLLAPMDDVTEMPFRILCKNYGADIMFTEFVASEGLIRNVTKSTNKLLFDDCERPIGIQIFGNNEESMLKAADKVLLSNPDFIDINCGCPVKKIVSKGCGAAMMLNPNTTAKIVSSIVKISNKPVTVKTRIGWDFNSINIEEMALKLQDAGISALTIHGRTRSQIYSGEANWDIISKVKNNPQILIPIIGNGDIVSGESAKAKLKKSNVDGLMIGRAAIGNPWIFHNIKEYFKTNIEGSLPPLTERISVCKNHLLSSVNNKGEKRAILEMRHHYVKYFKGVNDFKSLKIKLMQTENLCEVLSLLEEIKSLQVCL